MQHSLLHRALKPASTLGALALCPRAAHAHASEQGFVLLLPTDLYTGAGVVAVALTVLVLAFAPGRGVRGAFRGWHLPWSVPGSLPALTSCGSALLLLLLITVGLAGPRDPLANPLPLAVWTVFWIGLVSLQGLWSGAWRYLNPLSGPLLLLGGRAMLRLPLWVGRWPAVTGFLGFAYVLLADPAPSDPGRLARIAGFYWLSSFALAWVFGRRWLVQGEVFTVMMRAYGRAAPLGGGLGLPGWRLARARVPLAVAVLSVMLLATGSFDGLNETFWWLSLHGINPFEYPGRSGVIWQSTLGLVAANLGLALVFWGTLALGRLLAGGSPVAKLFCCLAPSLLPIALGYHVAHYLPSFMVDSQYALVALSDPFFSGADYLGLGEFYVSTGFFNTQDSVRRIYLTQAGAIVAGHVFAVLVAHAIALRLYSSHRGAALSQLPIAAFMIAYTWFGLWLLASPRF